MAEGVQADDGTDEHGQRQGGKMRDCPGSPIGSVLQQATWCELTNPEVIFIFI